MRTTRMAGVALALAAAMLAGSAQASLTLWQSYTGKIGYSSDGWGDTSNAGTISASVPAGSSVVAAYLYTSTYFNPSFSGVGGTLGGTGVAYASLGMHSGCCNLIAGRADVTSIVKPVIDAGPGGVYSFGITETSSSQDGSALVVVYSNGSLADSTIAILDGWSASGGDSFSTAFVDPLDPTAAGFEAEMALGIGFSCCSQKSTVKVNGTTITTEAGNFDDGVGGGAANGRLITVGGYDDPFSPASPSYVDDHERYNLVPYIATGDTVINVDTNNPSNDDNIFLAVFKVTGEGRVNDTDPTPVPVPEPGSLLLVALGLLGLGRRLRD